MGYVDLTGRRFGRLTVVSRAENGAAGSSRWLCKCDCGGETIAFGHSLKGGRTQSCGCLRRERIVESTTKHGDSHNRLYAIWQGMKRRCGNPAYIHYADYGGRGIRICDEWQNYQAFRDWSLSNGYADSLTIDRIDANGNYEPGNCRWVSRLVQAQNRRNTYTVEYKGATGNLKEMCRRFNVSYQTIKYRMKKGFSFAEAIDNFQHTSPFKEYVYSS